MKANREEMMKVAEENGCTVKCAGNEYFIESEGKQFVTFEDGEGIWVLVKLGFCTGWHDVECSSFEEAVKMVVSLVSERAVA